MAELPARDHTHEVYDGRGGEKHEEGDGVVPKMKEVGTHFPVVVSIRTVDTMGGAH